MKTKVETGIDPNTDQYYKLKEEPKKMTKELSTKFAEDYKIKEQPKNIKIEIGCSYTITDGSSGTRDVKITSIRKINEQVIIYFKWRKTTTNSYGDRKNKFWDFITGGSWAHDQRSIEVFKAQLLQYGQLKEIELVYSDEKPNLVLEEEKLED